MVNIPTDKADLVHFEQIRTLASQAGKTMERIGAVLNAQGPFSLGQIIMTNLDAAHYSTYFKKYWTPCRGNSIDGSDFHSFSGQANTPDIRGRFVRTVSVDNSVDPNGPRNPFSLQNDGFIKHTHPVTPTGQRIWMTTPNSGGVYHDGPTYGINTLPSFGSGTETRPDNYAVNYWLKRNQSVTFSEDDIDDFIRTQVPPIDTTLYENSVAPYKGTAEAFLWFFAENINMEINQRPLVGEIKTVALTPSQMNAEAMGTWVPIDGRGVDSTDYSRLTGRTSVPDARGFYFRGEDAGAGLDPGRELWSMQNWQMESHTHTWKWRQGTQNNGNWRGYNRQTFGTQNQTRTFTVGNVTPDSGIDTRMGDRIHPAHISVQHYLRVNINESVTRNKKVAKAIDDIIRSPINVRAVQ